MSSNIREVLKGLIRDELKQAQSTGGNRLGWVSVVNNDGTAVIVIDGVGVTATLLFPVVVGQQALVMPDNSGGYSACATLPNPTPTVFEDPPYFTGGLFRVCGSPPGAGAASPYEQFVPGYPTYAGVNFYVGAFQELTTGTVYLLPDPSRFYGNNFEFESEGRLSPNGRYYACFFVDQNANNLILQVWDIGTTLIGASVLNAAQNISTLQGTKLTEIVISFVPVVNDLGQYPMYGRFLPDIFIADSVFIYVVQSLGNPPIPDGTWVLSSNPSGDNPIAWLPFDDNTGPQWQLTPNTTVPSLNFEAASFNANTSLNSGEFCDSNAACNARGETYDVHGTKGTGIQDIRVDDNGKIYWLQGVGYSATVVTDTPTVGGPPLVPVGTAVVDGALLVAQGVGSYMYSQAVGAGKLQIGFWATEITNDVLDTNVTWANPSIPFYNAGGLFFFVNKQNHTHWESVLIYDYANPTLLAKVPINPATDPTFTGNYFYCLLKPGDVVATVAPQTVHYQSTNFNTSDIGTCSDSCSTEVVTPTFQDTLSIPHTGGFNSGVTQSEDFETVFIGLITGALTVKALQQSPGTLPPSVIAVANLYTDLVGSLPKSLILPIFTKTSGEILSESSQAFTSNPQSPPLSFNTAQPQDVSPGQTDVTRVRIYGVTGVAFA